jgi:hypothetical protein
LALYVAVAGLVACSGDSAVPPIDGGTDKIANEGAAPDETDSTIGLGRWDALPPMPEPPRFYVGVGAVADRVFVLGGFMAPQSTVAQAFDTKTATWQTLDPLPSPFTMPNVAVVGDRLFLLGGLQTQAVLEYDAEGHWLSRAPMPLANGRGAAFVGVWGMKVVIAGGVLPGQSNNALNTGVRMADVAAYDTIADTWEMLTPMTEARGYGMGVVVGDTFVVIGGSTNNERTAAVQSFDLVAGKWHDDPPLDQSLSSAAFALLGDRIYLIGGIASSSGIVSPATLLYGQKDGILTSLAPMPNPRFASGAAAVGSRIYVAGGIMMASPTEFNPVTTFDAFTP